MRRIRAYLVEDSALLRQNLTETLEELAAVTVIGAAEDESTALAWLGDDQNRCDLLIIDIFLKSGSGLGVLQAARDFGTARTLIVLSNFATADIRQGCARLGADKVFDKSNEIDELIGFCAGIAAGASAGPGWSPTRPGSAPNR